MFCQMTAIVCASFRVDIHVPNGKAKKKMLANAFVNASVVVKLQPPLN